MLRVAASRAKQAVKVLPQLSRGFASEAEGAKSGGVSFIVKMPQRQQDYEFCRDLLQHTISSLPHTSLNHCIHKYKAIDLGFSFHPLLYRALGKSSSSPVLALDSILPRSKAFLMASLACLPLLTRFLPMMITTTFVNLLLISLNPTRSMMTAVMDHCSFALLGTPL
jgi:hypothetical protein